MSKKGMYIIIQTRPCKVVNMSVSKTGKHGHMKASITGIDVINSSKHMLNIPGHNSVVQFELHKEDYSLVNIEEDTLEYLDENNKLRSIKVPEDSEVMINLRKSFDPEKLYLITIIRAPVERTKELYVDEECVESFKEDK